MIAELKHEAQEKLGSIFFKFGYGKQIPFPEELRYFFQIYDTEVPKNIEISDLDCDVHMKEDPGVGIFDTLGGYHQSILPESEGTIILYKDCIEKYALDLYERIKDGELWTDWSQNDFIEAVFKIVFWHELGHWITHWIIDKNDKRWDDSFWVDNISEVDSLFFHECLAQLFTHLFISYISIPEKASKYFIIFEYMQLNQPEPYTVYKQILTNNSFNWKRLFNIFPFIRHENSPQTLENIIYHLEEKDLYL
jgi:hypothetical protein